MASEKMSTAKAETKAANAPRIAAVGDLALYEQHNLCWRLIAPRGTTTDDIEGPEFCSAIADKLSDYDEVRILSESTPRMYWVAICVRGGRDGTGQTGRGRALLQVLDGYPQELRAIEGQGDQQSDDYKPVFDQLKRVWIPMWRRSPDSPFEPLNDGFPRREDCDQVINHHRRKATSVPPGARR